MGASPGSARTVHGWLLGATSCPWFPGSPLQPGYCGPDLAGLLLGSWTKNEGSLLLGLVCTISAADWEGSLETSSSDHPAQTAAWEGGAARHASVRGGPWGRERGCGRWVKGKLRGQGGKGIGKIWNQEKKADKETFNQTQNPHWPPNGAFVQ